MTFQLNALDPSNSGSGGASLLGTYRTADAFDDVLAEGYFREAAPNLRWTHALLVAASDKTGIVLISSDGETVTATEFGGAPPPVPTFEEIAGEVEGVIGADLQAILDDIAGRLADLEVTP